MIKTNKILKALTFAIGFAAIFVLVQNAMILKNGEYIMTKRMLMELEALKGENIDALFVGSSVVYNGCSPLKIYEETGIRTFSVGSCAQPIEISYTILKEILESQTPKVVFLEAGALFHGDEDGLNNLSWRVIMDNLPLVKAKLEIAKMYASKDFGDGYLSAVLPIVKYHSRWTELSSADFKTIKKESLWSMGENTTSRVVKSPYSRESIDKWDKELKDISEYSTIIDNVNKENTEKNEADATQSELTVSDAGDYYLKLILDLCKSRNAELVLFKIPKNTLPQYDKSAWTHEHYELASQTAEKLGINYLDFNYNIDADIDIDNDYFDGGYHLNIRGAHKLSLCLAKYIAENYSVEPQKTQLYDNALEKYKKLSKVAYLESEVDFEEYLKKLNDIKDNTMICFSVFGDFTACLNDTDYNLLEDLGLELAEDGQFMDAYAAVVYNGKLLYEEISNKKIDHTIQAEDHTIRLTSAGWLAGEESKIYLDETQLGRQSHGLNIVTFDNETNTIIDSVCFNTFESGKTCSRGNPYSMLNTYRELL